MTNGEHFYCVQSVHVSLPHIFDTTDSPLFLSGVQLIGNVVDGVQVRYTVVV